MAKTKAVVLCSGGLNSTVLATMTQQEHILTMMHVRIGHRADEREFELFEKQVDFFDPQHHISVEMPHFVAIGGNGRVDQDRDLENTRASAEGRSNSYIPGLVASLLSAACSWANVIGAGKIMIGVSEDLGPPGPRTSSIFPDFSREHVELCRNAILTETAPRALTVEMPLIDLPRADIIKLGQRLHAPFEMTWSCLSSGEEACGTCYGCVNRARGFVDAGLADPILSREMAGAQ
ncbi:MAG: 7-cyano-7-deazaguanine synthase [Planctomycetes bacterium]|nr:7-cyano-7-deazaguanine synthase [Planctomycetota bacterium]